MDLAALLEDAGLDVRRHGEHHHVTEGWLGLDCPLCTPDSGQYRLGVHPSGGCSCWACGPQSLAWILSLITRTPSSHWRQRLSGLWVRDSQKPRGVLRIPKGVGPLLPPHREYLRGRGFDPETLSVLWGVRGIGLAARLPWRLWIPVIRDERTQSWTTRSLAEYGTRYVSAAPDEEAVPHKELLGGEDHAERVCVVVEGPMDAFKVGPGAVWTFGSAVTNAQVYRISRYEKRVVCLDADAQARARELCSRLAVLPGTTVNVELDAKDPGSASERELELLRREMR